MSIVLAGILLGAGIAAGFLLASPAGAILGRIPRLGKRLVLGVIVPLLVLGAVAGVVVALSVIGNDGHEQLSAQLIAVWTLAAATFLLYATGHRERTASVDLEIGSATAETKIEKDGEVTEEIFAKLSADAQKKVKRENGKLVASEEIVVPATAPTIPAGQIVPADVYAKLDKSKKAKVTQQRGLYFRSLYVGADGRWSTSKLQALLWTYAILFALVALFAADQLGLEFIVGAKPGGGNELGGFVDLPFPEEYLFFLGGPFAAAVIAKASTTGKVQQGTVVKPPAGEGDGGEGAGSGLSDGLKEVISNDAGRTDLLDLQYFLFNLLALSVFLGTFVFNLNEGLPEIPLFLVALTGTSALTYATKKSIESATPKIDSVIPSSAYPGETLTVEGQHLLTPRAIAPRVMVDGREVPADGVTVERGTAADAVATIKVVVPSDTESGSGKTLVLTPLGATTPASSTITIRGAEIESVQPSSISLLPNARILISGKNLGADQPAGVAIQLGTLSLTIKDWTDWVITAELPDTLNADEIAPLGTTADLQLVIPGRGRASKAVTLAPIASSVTSAAPLQ